MIGKLVMNVTGKKIGIILEYCDSKRSYLIRWSGEDYQNWYSSLMVEQFRYVIFDRIKDIDL